MADDAASTPLAPQPGDALLMTFVFQLRPFDAAPHARAAVWDEIAHACVSSCSSTTDGGGVRHVSRRIDVTRRVSELTLILLEQPTDLPPELRIRVRAFHERNCFSGYGPRLAAGAFLLTLRKHATATGAVPMAPAPHATIGVAIRSDDPSIDASFRKRAIEDEWLLQLVMTHRPFDSSSAYRAAIWMAVQDAYHLQLPASDNESGRLASTVLLQQRLSTATTALLETTTPYHAYLSPRVRAMLIEFNMLTPSARVETRYNAPKASNVALQMRYNASKAMAAAEQMNTMKDELLLRLVLLKRPFDARDDDAQAAVWTDIATAYVAVYGDNTLKDGVGVKGRVTALTNTMLHDPHALKPALRAMLYENLERSRQQSSNVTETQPSEMVETPQQPHASEEAEQVTPATPSAPVMPARESIPWTETVQAGLDAMEVFMRIVLEKQPFDFKKGRRAKVWEEIASDFMAASGIIISPAHRISFLTKQALASPAKLSPMLYRMIVEYHELNCKSNARYKIDFDSLKKLQKHAALGEEEEAASGRRGEKPVSQSVQCDEDIAPHAGTTAELLIDVVEDFGVESEDVLELGCDDVVTQEHRDLEDAVAVEAPDEAVCGNDAEPTVDAGAPSTVALATGTGSESMELDEACEILCTSVQEPVTLPASSTRSASHTVAGRATGTLLSVGGEGVVPDDSTDTTAVGPMDVSEEEDGRITDVIRPRRRDENSNEGQPEVVASSRTAGRKRKTSSIVVSQPHGASDNSDGSKRRRVHEHHADAQGVESEDSSGSPAVRPASKAIDGGSKCAQDETTKLLEAVERDRRAYSVQHTALVAMLKAERTVHANETSSMLAAIERDRHERRDEFMAMVTLMAQNFPAAPAPTQRLHEVQSEPGPLV